MLISIKYASVWWSNKAGLLLIQIFLVKCHCRECFIMSRDSPERGNGMHQWQSSWKWQSASSAMALMIRHINELERKRLGEAHPQRHTGSGMKVGQCAASEEKCDLKADEDECIACQEVRLRPLRSSTYSVIGQQHNYIPTLATEDTKIL